MKNQGQAQKFISGVSGAVIYILFAIAIVYLFYLSLFTTCFMTYHDEHIYYLKDYAIVMSIGLILLVIVLAALKLQQRSVRFWRTLCIVMTVFVAAFLIAMISVLHLQAIYDEGQAIDGAAQLIIGDYTKWQDGGDFRMFAYQNGMVLSFVPFVLIFGGKAYMAVQYLNIFVMLLTYVAIALIAKAFFGEKIAYASYLAMLGFLPAWSMTTLVYGTWGSLCGSVWALYLELRYEKTKQWRYPIGIGLILAVSILCKSNASIMLIAVLILLLLAAVRETSWKLVGGALIILALCVVEMEIVPVVMHQITGEDTTGLPLTTWLAMGLQESSIAPGWYNEYPVNLYREYGLDQEALHTAIRQSFADSFTIFLQNPDYMVRFFSRKLAGMWADPAYQCFSLINTKDHGEFAYWIKDVIYNGGIVNTILYLLLDVLQSVIYFGVVLYLLLMRKDLRTAKAHLVLAFLGGFLFHFIGEAQSHYVIGYMLMILPFAVKGYAVATETLQSLWSRRKERSLAEVVIRTGIGRIALAMSALVILFTLLGGPLMTNTIKLGGEESEYLWFCQQETQWQADDYAKY